MAKKRIKKSSDRDVVANLENKLTRALADYDNLHKRFDREKDKFLQFANKGLVARFLVIYDMLASAQVHIRDSGIAIIIEEYKKILAEEGVELIRIKKGDKFNEETMDAVESVDAKKSEEGKIAEVLLSGWKFMDGPVIREAKVKVYKRNT